MDFSDSLVACDIKVDLCSQLKTFINTKGQGHLLTFVLDALESVL